MEFKLNFIFKIMILKGSFKRISRFCFHGFLFLPHVSDRFELICFCFWNSSVKTSVRYLFGSWGFTSHLTRSLLTLVSPLLNFRNSNAIWFDLTVNYQFTLISKWHEISVYRFILSSIGSTRRHRVFIQLSSIRAPVRFTWFKASWILLLPRW